MAKRVCVIGGGISGISAVKSCVEVGLEPTCFESRKEIGGIWYYNKSEKRERARAYESLITNVSKESSCFSDFPYPKEYTPFINPQRFQQYLKSYVDHFNLEKYFHLETEVVDVVEQDTEKGSNGRWRVTTRNKATSDTITSDYDCVMVCAGRFAKPIFPNFTGLRGGSFNGQVMHSCQFDTADDFEGKNVLIIGLGNSGGDFAADICRKAAKTILSTRSGAYIFPRTFKKGLPVDITLTSRLNSRLKDLMPTFLAEWITKKFVISNFDHKVLGVKSKYSPLNPLSAFLINDELPSRIVSGQIRIKPDISKFTSNEVHFVDRTKEEVEVVICATGYSSNFPFISDTILPDQLSDMKLFEWMIPFDITDPSSLGVIGIFPFFGGSAVPIIESQARYVSQVMSGITKLPSVQDMKTAFETDRVNYTSLGRPFVFKKKISVEYPDRIASMAGFYPSFWSLFFRDPWLALAVHTGPFLSYHYRLLGHFTWEHARERTMDVLKNTLYGISQKNHSRLNGMDC